MDKEILTNPTEAEVTACVHENLYALFRAMDFLPGYESLEKESFSFHHAYPENPMFKGVWRVRLDEDEVEDAVAEVVAWFEARNAASFFWWIDPETTPSDLTRRLLDRGFDGNPEGDPGMVADLNGLNEDVRAPKGFRLLPATDEQTMVHWRDVFSAAYGAPPAAGQAWVDATVAAQGSAPWNLYVGYLGDRPVATSLLFCGAGVTGERCRTSGAQVSARPPRFCPC